MRPRTRAATGPVLGSTALCRLAWSVAVCLLCALLVTGSASAQVVGPPSPPSGSEPSTATLEELLAELEDPVRRAELIERLRTLIRLGSAEPEPEARPRFIDDVAHFLQSAGAEAGHSVTRIVGQIATLPARLRDLRAILADPDARPVLLRSIGSVLGVLALALLVAGLARRALRRPSAHLVGERTPPFTPLARAGRSALHLLLQLLPPALLLGVTWIALPMVDPLPSVDPPSRARAVVLALATGIASSIALRRGIDAVLAPRTPAVRLIPVDDAAARSLAQALSRVGSFGLLGFSVVAAVRAAGGERALLEALESLYALALLVMSITLVLRFRHWPATDEAADDATGEATDEAALRDGSAGTATAAPLATDEPRGWRGALRRLARLGWIVALVYVLGLYALWVSDIEGAFGAAIAATGLTLLYAALGVVGYLLGSAALRELGLRAVQATKRFPSIRRRVPRYLATARLSLGVLIAVFAAGFAVDAWGIRPLSALQSLILDTLLSVGVGVLAVILLAFAVVDIFTALTENYLLRKRRLREDSSKLRTLVPLSQKFIKLVVFVIATITVLGQVGVSIGPMLASIGVVGLAIGFGAQTLVKDVITGVFILLEDAVSVGDVIRVGDTSGAVEAINIRTIMLRDSSGVLHTIPYSSVTQIANLTKDFSYFEFACAVSQDEDIDAVIELLRRVGAELQADWRYTPRLLGPIEIFGLDRFADATCVITGRLKTVPAQQWSIGREFNRRLKQALDAAGIKLPSAQRTIWFGDDKSGASPPPRVAEVSRQQPVAPDDGSAAP